MNITFEIDNDDTDTPPTVEVLVAALQQMATYYETVDEIGDSNWWVHVQQDSFSVIGPQSSEEFVYNPYHEQWEPKQLERRWVNVYDVARVYGGPEEGGWWYDTGQPILTTYVHEGDPHEVAKALREQFPDTGRSSSVLGGEDYRVAVEPEAGKPYPTERPHYE